MSLLGEMKVSAEQMRLLIMTDAFSNETGVRQYRQVFFYDNRQRREQFSLATGDGSGVRGEVFSGQRGAFLSRQVQVREIFQAEAFQNRHVTE